MLCGHFRRFSYATVLNQKLYLETFLCIYQKTIQYCFIGNTVNHITKKDKQVTFR